MRVVIITTLKPMLPEFRVEQTNAVQSWKHLRCEPIIVVVGDDSGVAEFCAQEGVLHHKSVRTNAYGTPFIGSVLQEGYRYARDDDIVAYVNGDIVLANDFCDTLDAFCAQYAPLPSSFLLTAVRFNWTNFVEIDFGSSDWLENLSVQGGMEKPTGIDLFVHRKGAYAAMPDSAVAKFTYDSWMLMYALKNFEVCVNITGTCRLLHQYGKWYQGGQPCARGTQTEELAANEQQTSAAIARDFGRTRFGWLITDCPIVSHRVNREIRFSKVRR